jgi:predicted MFS family arabinose efflux permease
LLLQFGLPQTWMGLGALSLLLTVLSWGGWPRATPVPAQAAAAAARAAPSVALKLLYFQYALMAVGLVPMMVFLVDYVARGLGWGMQAASLFWVVYGVGAIAGPILCGALADRIGFSATNRLSLTLQVLAIAVAVVTTNHAALLVATFFIGTFPPGIVPITLGRIQQELPGDPVAQHAAWSKATTVFALFQALAGYAYSYLFAHSGGDHLMLLAIGGWALVLALAADLAMVSFRRSVYRP